MKNPLSYTSSFIVLTAIAASCLTKTAFGRADSVDFASPLQSLTLWDDRKGGGEASPRAKFLPRYKAGLEAEFKTEELIQAKFQEAMDKLDKKDSLWPLKARRLEKQRIDRLESATAKAFDRAMAKHDASVERQQQNDKNRKQSAAADTNKYQFVGVIQKNGPREQPVQWYARKKPRGANWSVRMIHVNKDAIVKDLHDQGRLDIEAKYKNNGGGRVTATYKAKERSWKTFWNFSPVGFFTDSSGHYWRERRLREGVFTDGRDVYESRYRYKDGKNGMYKTKVELEEYMRQNKFTSTMMEAARRQVKEGKPDVVIECPVKEKKRQPEEEQLQ